MIRRPPRATRTDTLFADATFVRSIDDDTLVIFTSDNGGAWYNGMQGLNAPFRGWKATFFEGGIRAPLFMRWPGGIAAGTQRTDVTGHRSEEHTSELQSLMRISYAVCCLKKNTHTNGD